MADRISLGQLCCQSLTRLLGAKAVLLPGSAGYNDSLTSYYTPQAATVHPACFVTPHTVADVSAIVKTLTAPQALSCEFAVRSGGHMWFPGAASAAAPGVTIDLRGLNSVVLSSDRSTVSVGPGVSWEVVYEKLDKLGLSVAGGRVAGVGVGGLTLGGGVSFFGPRRGWTCNQAVSFEVVLADGSIVQASETKNRDLWWALRGGSNNLGIVTRISLATFKQGLLWSVLTLNPLSVVKQQAKVYGKMMKAENYDESASFLTGWGYSEAQGLNVALNQLIYTKPASGDASLIPKFYKDVIAFPPVIPAAPVVANMSTLAIGAGLEQQPQAARFLQITVTFGPTEAMILAAFEAFNSSLPAVKGVKGLRWALNIEPLPPQLYARGAADNALGLADRKGTLAICLLSPTWPNAADDAVVYAAGRALMADVERRAKKLGVWDRYIYLNYAAPWQEVIPSYGADSVRKLQKVRKAVDPKGVFTFRVPGGFKIPL